MRYGNEYLNDFIIDSHCGSRTARKNASDAVVFELKRKYKSCQGEVNGSVGGYIIYVEVNSSPT